MGSRDAKGCISEVIVRSNLCTVGEKSELHGLKSQSSQALQQVMSEMGLFLK